MAIVKKEVSSPVAVQLSAPVLLTPPSTGSAPGRELSSVRQAVCHDVFQGGWFKDMAQTMSVDDAIKKGLEVAAQIEAWVTR